MPPALSIPQVGSPTDAASEADEDIAETASLQSANKSGFEDKTRLSSNSSSQKRRRVTRACDECRRKKIKCDGKQPCTHCTVYSYDCTYDQPSHRRRNPTPQYVEALEQRLARAETVIHTLLPNLDLDDPSLGTKLHSLGEAAFNLREQRPNISDRRSSSIESNLESMVEATGQLEIDERGHWDYHGHSSGLSFIRRLREQLGDLNGPEQADDKELVQREPRSGSGSTIPRPKNAFNPGTLEPDSPNTLLGQGIQESPFETPDIGTDELPSRELALALCSAALDDACAILKFVHSPTFYHRFNRIYDLDQEDFEDQDHKFLPLLYVVLALGCLFAKDEHSELARGGYKNATGVGYKYFWAARQLMDITDCRDLTSLQAIAFMIMFLQCSAKLATCYAYIGVALRSALRMGLHRAFKDNFNPIESECRKRVFWAIRKMDIYVGAMLGLPQTLHDDDIDQLYPTEVTDECITADGIVPLPPNSDPPPMAAANANFRLCKTVSKIVRTIYPIKGFQSSEQDPSRAYSVSYTSIKEIEMDLQQWMESLPPQLVPGYTPTSPGVIRMQQLLRMAYAHAQLMLYRPFLHYVSSKRQVKSVNQRSYACAAACVSVSRNIIHITAEMKHRGLLQGSYWFSMYSTFFGILSLIFFALENPASAHPQEVYKDAREGKETLAVLAKRSMAADRCTATLNILFEQLGPALENSAASSAARKRGTPQAVVDIFPPQDVSDSSTERLPLSGNHSNHGKRSRTKDYVLPPNTPQNVRMTHLPHNAFPQPRHQSLPSPASYVHNICGDSPATNPGSSGFGDPHSGYHHQLYSQQQQQQQQQHHQHHNQNHAPFLPSQSNQYPGKLGDMSALMYPSDNPFAYPIQPMTTLEQNYAFDGQPNPNDPVQNISTSEGPEYLDASTAGAATVSADEHIDVHLLGPLPPYLSYSHHNNNDNNTNMNTNQWDQNMTPTSGAEMWNQQARSHGLPGMNLDNIFAGEDWQGYES